MGLFFYGNLPAVLEGKFHLVIKALERGGHTVCPAGNKIGFIAVHSFFVYTAPFRSCRKAMGLSDDGLLTLEKILLENPQKGDVIEGTGGKE